MIRENCFVSQRDDMHAEVYPFSENRKECCLSSLWKLKTSSW